MSVFIYNLSELLYSVLHVLYLISLTKRFFGQNSLGRVYLYSKLKEDICIYVYVDLECVYYVVALTQCT